MALSVIGAGFGRTGTSSLKIALEHLGFGPCYHLVEARENPASVEHAECWVRAANGQPMDWDEVFAGYNSTVDWPAADYYLALAQRYPAARVILTRRDSESWFKSAQKTIFSPLFSPLPSDMSDLSSPAGEVIRASARRHFGGGTDDRERCIAGYERHNAEVERSIPANRLLVFDVAEGWEPLCRFLGRPIPPTPFPKANTTDEFRRNARSTARQLRDDLV